MVVSWAPAAQGPSHDATFYAPSFLRNNFCKLHTFSFFGPVSVFFAQEGPPNEFFGTFFGSVFGRARVQISNVPLLKSVFFCNVKKVRSKGLIGYAAWGLPQGPACACTLTRSNKAKKQKLKKTQVLFRILISNKHFGARCENTKCFSYIRFPNKTCVFFSFCFFVLLDMVRVHAKAGPWGRPHAAYPI